MKEITKYVSEDGREFDTKEECTKHEDVLASLMSFADTIRKYCSARDDCQGCQFGYGNDCVFVRQSPEEWDIENCDGYTEERIENTLRDTPSIWHIHGEDNNPARNVDCSTDAPIYRGMPEFDD